MPRLRLSTPPALAIAIAIAIGACGGDRPTEAGPPPSSIVIVDGDGQSAVAGTLLGASAVVRVVDAFGNPVRGAPVRWSASDGGEIVASSSTTDALGESRAAWTLAGIAGDQHATATVLGAPTSEGDLAATFTAHASARTSLPFDRLTLLSLSTYDGSGQVVHPDVVHAPGGFGAGALRLAITPYPEGNSADENPSLYTGDDGALWSVPDGVTNPLVSPARGYLSDPDMLWVPERSELWLYYRQVTSANIVHLVTSHDGVHWSAPTEVARAPNHEIISPAVVHLAPNDWRMWSVNAEREGCRAPATTVELRRSTDGVTWSAPVTVPLSQPGGFVWHLDVDWIPSRGEFWALVVLKQPGSCNPGAAYLLTSTDGEQWTSYLSPVLSRGAIPAFQDVVYRSTLDYDATEDAITFWFSGARYDGSAFIWSAATLRRHRADVFTDIRAAQGLATPGSTAPALTNETAP